jgi:hypothetical protein
MLAALTLSTPLLANVVREVAIVAVRAILARHAGEALADAAIFIAEIGRRAGVEPASDL